MIQLVLQKKFLEFVTANFDYSKKVYDDFRVFLMCTATPMTVYTDCDKEDFISFRLNEKPNLLIQLLCNTKFPKVETIGNYTDLINDEFFNDGCSFKVFFIDATAAECSALRNQYGYEFFCPENFETAWMKFYTRDDRDDLFLPVSKKGFNSWNLLQNFKHTFLTAIVIDPYILDNKDLIANNINNIIKELLSFSTCNKKIEVLVITTDNAKELSNAGWEERYAILSRVAANYENVEVNLFRYPKNIPDHARGVFTNYWYIYSGNSFTYFNANGQMRGNINDNIFFFMNFYKRTIGLLKERLHDAENFIIESKNELKQIGLQELKKRRFTTNPIADDYMPALIKTIKSFSE